MLLMCTKLAVKQQQQQQQQIVTSNNAAVLSRLSIVITCTNVTIDDCESPLGIQTPTSCRHEYKTLLAQRPPTKQ